MKNIKYMDDQKIRVAFFSDMLTEDYDGCVRTIYQIINRIPHSDFKFLFVTGVPPQKEGNINCIEVPTLTIPLNKSYKVALPFLQKSRIIAKLDQFKPDLIHISNPSPLGKLGVNYAEENKLPLISIYHTHFKTYAKYYLKRVPFLIPSAVKSINSITRNIYDKCDLLYVPVQNIIKEFSKNRFRTDHMKVWARGIDLELFTPLKRSKSYIKSIVNNNRPNILFASRLVWEKNLKTLLSIYERAIQDDLDYNFIIAGDGTASEELKNKMPNAFFVGNLDHQELSVLYASCDAFLFPSDTETYGNVIVEAMASGLPCVAANSGGPKGIISHSINGYLCSSFDTEDYLKYLGILLRRNSIRNRIIENGLNYVSKLSWDKLCDEYFSDIRVLASKRISLYA